MELDFQIDTSWCPVCNRHILPKRYLVPVQPLEPSPSDPSHKTPDASAARPSKKNSAARARGGGLVHGTGRVKPNGTIKRSDSAKKNRLAPTDLVSPPNPAKSPSTVKQRTVIDQGPTPLYCSDECRLADINASFGAISPDFNPNRQSPPIPPVPHNSLTSLSSSPESESGSSAESNEPLSAASLNHAAIPSIFGLPQLPPAPPLARRPSSPEYFAPNNYQSGVMMAAQRIKAALCPDPPKRSSFAQPDYTDRSKERKPIPGWTDGSGAWRASVYSFSAPRDPDMPVGPDYDDRRAYKSFVAFSHRSKGVYSTLDESHQTPAAPPLVDMTASQGLARNRTVEELYSKYPLALSRRAGSRTSLSMSPTLTQARSLPATIAPIIKRKEVPLLKRGAEGKLLVPDVKLKVSTSYVSVSGSTSITSESSRSSRLMRRDSNYSEYSMASVSELTEDETSVSSFRHPKPTRPTVETRSWSYDNLLTYPIMQLPPKKEKRIEKRIVDGVEQNVEVEIDVAPPPLKRLFLFPGKEVR